MEAPSNWLSLDFTDLGSERQGIRDCTLCDIVLLLLLLLLLALPVVIHTERKLSNGTVPSNRLTLYLCWRRRDTPV